jgi:hypothetical protein
MITNGIWDEVRNNLKKAIDNVSDETTELFVIPFAFDKEHHQNLNVYSAVATDKGKASLKDKINELKTAKNTMTFHSDPLNDFYTSRVNKDRVTYMFFLTDGQNEEFPDKFKPLLKEWGHKYGGQNVYGFYVMLHNLARDKSVEDIISGQEHLWKVQTADVNINLIRMQPTAIFNVRNDKFFELSIDGKINGKNFYAQFAETDDYKVTKTEVDNKKLRVYVSSAINVSKLPESKLKKLIITMAGGDKYDFLVTETVAVTCESKREKSLKISVR